MSRIEPGPGTPGKVVAQAVWTLHWYSYAFLESPVSVIAPREEAAWREAILPTLLVVLNGPVKIN